MTITEGPIVKAASVEGHSAPMVSPNAAAVSVWRESALKKLRRWRASRCDCDCGALRVRRIRSNEGKLELTGLIEKLGRVWHSRKIGVARMDKTAEIGRDWAYPPRVAHGP